MAIAFSIFFVGTLFALIYLYNVTKDRWDWTKLAKLISNIVPLIIASLFFLFTLVWFSEKETRNLGDYLLFMVAISLVLLGLRRLTYDRWNWGKITRITLYSIALIAILSAGFFFYEMLTKIYDNYQTDALEKRELAARSCNAAEINIIEPKIRQSISSINERTNIQEMHSILAGFNNSAVEESNPLYNIKMLEVKTSIKPNCQSNFHYQLEAIFNEDGILNTFKTYAINPPKGYRHFAIEVSDESKNFGKKDDTYYPIEELSIDFVAKRQAEQERLQFLERKAAEAARIKMQQESDPCAPGITRKERMTRLSKFGRVREIGNSQYSSGVHEIQFGFVDPSSVLWCR